MSKYGKEEFYEIEDEIIDRIDSESSSDEPIELAINFENGEELKNGKPRYGGDNGRSYSSHATVGWDEYVDSSNGVSRILHNGERVVETVNSDNPVTLTSKKERANEAKKHLTLHVQQKGGGVNFTDLEGESIESRISTGTIRLVEINLEDIGLAGSSESQIRDSAESYNLQESIAAIGLLTPLHVVPFGKPIGYEFDENGEEIKECPIYTHYRLLHGRRRYDACVNLGYQTVVCLVDTTIPDSLIQTYQAMAHSGKPYKFSEQLNYINLLKEQQPNLSTNLIEAALGLHNGEYFKALYIDHMRVDYADPYNQVESGKSSIDQAFKKLEKDIAKAEKEEEKGMDGDDVEDALRDKGVNELDQLAIDVHKQEVGNRTILDAVVRRTVESRDNGECQCCGFGHGESDFMGIFNVHHMVAVQYGGSDSKLNLILLCQNCHKLVHDYEMGRFNPEQSTFDRLDQVKKIVVIGNILRQQRIKAITTIRQKDAATGRQLDKGVISIGKALKKLNIDLKGEQDYLNGSPYDEFIHATKKLEVGGTLEGTLADFEVMDEEQLCTSDAEGDISTEDDIMLDDLLGV